MKKVLLIEPDYKNKYPPMGLMKLSTYHKESKKWDVVAFWKGDLKKRVLTQYVDIAIDRLYKIDNQIHWHDYKALIFDAIKLSSGDAISRLCKCSPDGYDRVEMWLKDFARSYRAEEFIDEVKWDRICITTLFTFYWNKTIETIAFAKKLVRNPNQLFVGGIMASLVSKEIEKETGIAPIKGLLDKPGILDANNKTIIDELPLDYSILDEIEYKYPASDAYYLYSTRGCIRSCAFCAVPKIEPRFKPYISISDKLKDVEDLYGKKSRLLLMDNNVLASPQFPRIIKEIKKAGFQKGAKVSSVDDFDSIVKGLDRKHNNGFIIKNHNFIFEVFKTLKGEHKSAWESALNSLGITEDILPSVDKLKNFHELTSKTYRQAKINSARMRYVDFNQGIDGRLIDEKNIKLLSEIAINPLRIAFDHLRMKDTYIKAVKLAAEHNITHLSNYLLYNFKDTPDDLYERMRINVDLCEELNISIYSFPMKYNPIDDPQGLFKNRDYLGEYWNRKYIRAIQAILNATKGKVGRGKHFFDKAFGKNLKEYHRLLLMPEKYIIYRLKHEKNGSTEKWWNSFGALKKKDRELLLPIIYSNNFAELPERDFSDEVREVLKHYKSRR